MATEAGRRAAIAFRAVKQCHGHLGKLLRDLDVRLAREEWTPLLWGSRDAVTYDMSKSVLAEHWMPERIYRFYKTPAHTGIAWGLNVWFFGSANFEEPLLVVGCGRYLIPSAKMVAVHSLKTGAA
jgi:hypothetical protein